MDPIRFNTIYQAWLSYVTRKSRSILTCERGIAHAQNANSRNVNETCRDYVNRLISDRIERAFSTNDQQPFCVVRLLVDISNHDWIDLYIDHDPQGARAVGRRIKPNAHIRHYGLDLFACATYQ